MSIFEAIAEVVLDWFISHAYDSTKVGSSPSQVLVKYVSVFNESWGT